MRWCVPKPRTGWCGTNWICCGARGAIEAFTQLLDAHLDVTAARLEQDSENAEASRHMGTLLFAVGAVEDSEALFTGKMSLQIGVHQRNRRDSVNRSAVASMLQP